MLKTKDMGLYIQWMLWLTGLLVNAISCTWTPLEQKAFITVYESIDQLHAASPRVTTALSHSTHYSTSQLLTDYAFSPQLLLLAE